MKHVLPVCGCQRPLLCCGVLGRQHKEEGCGQAGEEAGAVVMLIGQAEAPGPFSFITPRRRGGVGRWTSLHEST